eukprot:1393183-Amorphochlora_amoeboformis.AAC.1
MFQISIATKRIFFRQGAYIFLALGIVFRHLAIGLDTMLEAVKLPASITDLDTGLTKLKIGGGAFACDGRSVSTWNLPTQSREKTADILKLL